MNTYYVSLVQDLLGCYLIITADSEMAVRYYLYNKYKSGDGEWKLPWCSIYTEEPKVTHYERPILIRANIGQNLFEEYEKLDFELHQVEQKPCPKTDDEGDYDSEDAA